MFHLVIAVGREFNVSCCPLKMGLKILFSVPFWRGQCDLILECNLWRTRGQSRKPEIVPDELFVNRKRETHVGNDTVREHGAVTATCPQSVASPSAIVCP